MRIRPLDPQTDRAAVEGFFQEVADYIRLERGAGPDASVTDDYFSDAPPGIDPATSLHLGLFDGGMTGIAELSFGYPSAKDAYLGLLIIAPATRGSGAGAFFLRHLEREARGRGASHIYLGVLDANPRGRAFWEREGFTLALANRQVTIGGKTQLAHRLGKRLA